jgi:hypothetical protein
VFCFSSSEGTTERKWGIVSEKGYFCLKKRFDRLEEETCIFNMIMGFTDLKLRSWVCGFNLEVSKSKLRRHWFNYYFFKINYK